MIYAGKYEIITILYDCPYIIKSLTEASWKKK